MIEAILCVFEIIFDYFKTCNKTLSERIVKCHVSLKHFPKV